MNHFEHWFHGVSCELALAAAGHLLPRLSQLAKYPPKFGFPIRLNGADGYWSVAILDVTMTESGALHLIEANGSNGGLTSGVLGTDSLRAMHMADTFFDRNSERNACVAVLAYKPGFMHLGEFHSRAAWFASLLSQRMTVALVGPDEVLGTKEVVVVCGPIPEIANGMRYEGDTLLFKDRAVRFATNPNLLPELLRRGIIRDNNTMYEAGGRIFHDGPLLRTFLDKGAQQLAAMGTKITPLQLAEAWSLDEAVGVVEGFHGVGKSVVGKMNAGSGGAGVELFPTALPVAEVSSRLNQLIESARQSYGEQVMSTLFPIRFFEFVQSAPYWIRSHPHLWDLRVLCLISPGFVEVLPTLVRICPKPFCGERFDRERVVSNLTGRPPSLEWVRSPFDPDLLDDLGFDQNFFGRVAKGCAEWCWSALGLADRGGR